MEQWARNVLHDGDDLGYPHISPEQKMVIPHSGTIEDMSSDEKLIMSYMASLPNREPMMLKVASLHFIERNWWYGEVRRKAHWLKPERGRSPQQMPERMKPVNLRLIERDKWIKKLRTRGFKPMPKVNHRPGKLILGDGETVAQEKPSNELWMAYIKESHGIKQSEYYRQLSTLRRRIYYMLN